MNTDNDILNKINDGIAKYTIKDVFSLIYLKIKNTLLYFIRLFIMRIAMLQRMTLIRLHWKMFLWLICITIWGFL